jgi:hypothetical protein
MRNSLFEFKLLFDFNLKQEILEAVVVRNLDTGETLPLSEAEKSLPSGVNPLALHIMRLTTEFSR